MKLRRAIFLVVNTFLVLVTFLVLATSLVIVMFPAVVTSLLVLTTTSSTPRPPQTSGDTAARTFTVYDNIFYRGKPGAAAEGLVPSNILYEASSGRTTRISASYPTARPSPPSCASTPPTPARWCSTSSACR